MGGSVVIEPVIVDAVRTPIGRHAGQLSRVRPDDLAAVAIRGLLERTGIAPESIEDVIFGCANQAGEDNRNIARMALLLAGLPVAVPGQTVNRLCGSGLQAIVSAAQAIRSGEGECFIAGGVESMSRAPWVMLKPDEAFSRAAPAMTDTTVGWRFVNPRMPSEWTISLGETAEEIADRLGISRDEQDAFALESQSRTACALAADRFADELVAVPVRDRTGVESLMTRDEHPRPEITLDQLGRMIPAFRREGGTVTAGSSSGINDGAAAALIMSDSAAREAGLTPLARVVASAVAGVSPEVMGLGPIPATRRALQRAGLRMADIDVVELNEAFAAQAIACIRELGMDPARVNVNGGAISLGHPLGASGSRIIATLAHELKRRRARYGLATMCIGVGQGIATIIERSEAA